MCELSNENGIFLFDFLKQVVDETEEAKRSGKKPPHFPSAELRENYWRAVKLGGKISDLAELFKIAFDFGPDPGSPVVM